MNTTEKNKTKTITIRINEDLHKSLNDQAISESKTTSNLIRDILYNSNEINFKSGINQYEELHRRILLLNEVVTKNTEIAQKNLSYFNDIAFTLNKRIEDVSNQVDSFSRSKVERIGMMNVLSYMAFISSIFLFVVMAFVF